MAEVLVSFSEPVLTKDGSSYLARACGAERDDGLWHGWLEFTSSDKEEVLRSGRETTQPNRQDLMYWATGLTPVYLEGALHRALTPLPPRRVSRAPAPAFDGPADHGVPETVDPPGILNPFSVYRKGEPLLRRQLGAFSKWHLVNIIQHYGLSQQRSDALDRLTEAELVELILAAVRERSEGVGSGRFSRTEESR